MNPLKWDEQTRAGVYRITLAILAIAVAYGLITDSDAVAAWTALITAITGNGLAALNTSLSGSDD